MRGACPIAWEGTAVSLGSGLFGELTLRDPTPADSRPIAKARRDRSTAVANMRLVSILTHLPLSIVEELSIGDLSDATAIVTRLLTNTAAVNREAAAKIRGSGS